jgi:hypothetical protein
MQEFVLRADPYSWTAPPGITQVLVEMWGGGGGGGDHGGSGGAYSRSVVLVTPGKTYTIVVGAGGDSLRSGSNSSVSLDGVSLIFAGGGHPTANDGLQADLATTDPSAAISKPGAPESQPFGGSAFGASFCRGPEANLSGRGGDTNQSGHAGYVLLTW